MLSAALDQVRVQTLPHASSSVYVHGPPLRRSSVRFQHLLCAFMCRVRDPHDALHVAVRRDSARVRRDGARLQSRQYAFRASEHFLLYTAHDYSYTTVM